MFNYADIELDTPITNSKNKLRDTIFKLKV